MKQKIINLRTRHVLLFAILMELSTFIIVCLINGMLTLFIRDWPDNYYYLVTEAVYFIVVLSLLLLIGNKEILNCGMKGFGGSLLSGIFSIILSCILIISHSVSEAATAGYKPSPELLAFLLYMALVGLTEEIFYRGLITEMLLRHYGTSPGELGKVSLLSAVLFSLDHIRNVIAGYQLQGVLIQCVAVFFGGLFFSAIYIRHRNIYAVAFIHALWDFSVYFPTGMFQDNRISICREVTDFMPELFRTIRSYGIFLIIYLIIFRKSVRKRLSETTYAAGSAPSIPE